MPLEIVARIVAMLHEEQSASQFGGLYPQNSKVIRVVDECAPKECRRQHTTFYIKRRPMSQYCATTRVSTINILRWS